MEHSNTVTTIELGTANLGYPCRSFCYPHQVVCNPNMDLEEKRAILAAWASDEHVVESLPTLRHLPGTPFPVTFSSIMDARIRLDRLSGADDDDPTPPPAAARRLRTRTLFKEAA